ncbi:capsid cement protein [Veronia pacifica]|uniref:Uncharacterized protein n=1 Tax=Veronia pacifica TaxID=1080227 RepID=A0A1C3E9F9_9GAMM|nr:capsid cement protein [Veronia pacifica]ODA29863.1 hypothetical protein A8L45_21410 [Veronia pacifica]
MHIAEGKKIDIVAPEGGVDKDVPIKYGALIVVPHLSVPGGTVVSARYTGLFDGPLKPGDEPAFRGEPAYFKDGEFTKTKPTESGQVKVPIGVFVDGGVLLTGVQLAG